MVRRETPVRCLNCRMSSITRSAYSILEPPLITFGPFSRFTNFWSNTARIGLMAESGSLSFSSSVISSTPALTASLDRRFIRVIVENVPAAHLDVFQCGQGHKILDGRAAPLGAFPQPNGSQLGQRPDRLTERPLDCFEPRDERPRHRAHAGYEYTQLAFGGRNLDVVWIGQNTVSF